MRKKDIDPMPWRYLDEYRGKDFEGEWPTLPQMFDISTKRFADNRCFEVFSPKHEIFTYRECQAWFNRIANWLYSQGVRKGDRVAVTGKNSPQWGIAYMGIVYMGAVVVPVDASLTDAEIEKLIDFVEVKGIFLDADKYDRIGLDNKYGFKVSLEEKKHEDSYILNLPDVGTQPVERPAADDLAAFLFTSGTTGTPKAVMLCHENLTFDAYAVQCYMNVRSTDVFYAILPIHHAYTMLAVFIESMTNGSNIVFGKKLVVSTLLKEMKEGHVNMLLAVPMLYNKIFSAIMKGIKDKGPIVYGLVKAMMKVCGFIKQTTGFNPGRVIFRGIRDKVSLADNRICISGAGPLPAETFKGFNELGVDFIQGYGLTETSPIVTLNPAYSYQYNSIGKPFYGVEVDFINKDENGNGEIVTRGKHVMKGYYQNPEATAETIDENGWLRTGDVGYQDKEGFVYLTGRAKNIIVTDGGKNVFPEEIEDHFQLYYDIEQICVVGYTEDEKMKIEGVAVLIYPSADAKGKYPDEGAMKMHMEQIVATVNRELLPYKRIRKVFVVDEPLEMTSTKKIKRFAVAKKYKDMINA
ncbi:MAG: AMP-binding protein [Sphaerochaetaceae bacterium]|nr:AMP-binding protein [Sphaerochaetaceae bacterium]